MANPGLVAETKEVLKTLPDLERLLKKQEKFVYFLSLSQKKAVVSGEATDRSAMIVLILHVFVVVVFVLTRWATKASYNLNRSSLC